MIYRSLRLALRQAVPYRMADLQARGGPDDRETGKAIEFLKRFTDEAKITLFHNPHNDVSTLFNELATSMAVLSWLKDGVTLFGERWKAGETALPEAPVPIVADANAVCQCGKLYRHHNPSGPSWARLCDGRTVTFHSANDDGRVAQ